MKPRTAGLPGTPAGEFLESVRRALGRNPGPPAPRHSPLMEGVADLEAKAEVVRRRLAEGRPALLDRLARLAELGGWKVRRAPGYEEAIGYIEALVRSLGARHAVRSDQEVFGDVPVDEALATMGVSVTTVAQGGSQSRESLRQRIIDADVGITGADYAVAETGSVVVVPGKGLSRLVSLVPPVHLALVRPEEVVESLDDLFLLRRLEYHRRGGDMGSYLNFITGPSRTADIEQTIVVGVHGPKEAHLVLLA